MAYLNNMLDLESLRCFVVAAQRGSFRAAAAAVHLSPPAFSDRIRRLEEDLDARLFERTTRRIRLTPAGTRLLAESATLFDVEARCRARVASAEGDVLPYELTVGTRFELGMSWLVPALDGLAKDNPQRRLHLYFGDSEDLLRQVHTGHVDALVTSARLPFTRLDYASLFDERYVFVAAPRTIADRPLRRAADAEAHTLIDAHADLPLFRYFLDAVPAEPAWRFEAVERMGVIAAVRQRILRGRGVGVLPEYFVRADLKQGRLVRLMPKVKLKQDVFRLIWPLDHPRAPELRELAAALRRRPLK